MRNWIKSAGLLAGVAIGGLRGVARGIRDVPSGAASKSEADPVNAVARLGWKSWVIILLFLGSVAGVAGALVVISGIVPIQASSGHWPITEWFLHFSMKRSIATHSMSIATPPLDKSGLVLKGAVHYDYACRPCHGAPDLRQPKVAAGMTPVPPNLNERIPNWKPRELFYLVKHGVKFTGMPAWPSPRRDDEVWAMVAFLQQFPRLDGPQYNRLAARRESGTGEAAPMEALVEPEGAPRPVVDSCGRCHGADGLGRGPDAFPRLAGQREEYLYASLHAYAHNMRHSGIMQPLAATLSEPEMRELARYYAGRPAGPPPAQSGDAALGRSIAHAGVPDRRIPACASCHGPDPVERNETYPVLAGQYPDYLLLQLELFKAGNRGGTRYAHIMQEVVRWLTAEEMQAVAAYYGFLKQR